MITYFIFHIINAIATQEEDIPVTDERDKIIELKATRNSHHVFSAGMAMALISMTLGITPVFLFIAFFACSLLSEIVDNISQIYYHRIGV